jgi:NAD(P)-dependent dehydrogenase (short-subunit alcohol dehydrogenase family)
MGERSAAVAIVTGGAQGLGLALARELADRGWRLVIDARRAERLDPAVADLAATTAVTGVAGDVTDPAHRTELVRAAHMLGDLRLVVNNASTLGTSPLPTLADLAPDTFRRIFEVNVVAPFALLAEAGLEDGATAVGITSDAGAEAYPGWGGYGASKAALEHASRVLAAERPGLRVLVVDPGDLRTEMHQDAFPGEDISDRPLPETVAPAIVELVLGDRPGGRYRASDLVGATGAP